MATVNKTLLKKWLEDERNQCIPIFIWSRRHTPEDEENAVALFDEEVSEPFEHIREFFTFRGKPEEFAWSGKAQSDGPVLCFRDDGSYPGFYCFDHIHTDDDGTFYMYSRRHENRQYSRPFYLTTALKRAIADHADEWCQELKHSITRDELITLLGDTWLR